MDENKSVNEINPEESSVKEPAIEEPAIEEPTVEEPAVEEPAVEESAVEEPAVEEPAVEVPAVEEPTVEEPAVEVPEADIPAEPEFPPKKEGGEYDSRGYYVFPDRSYYDLLGNYYSAKGEQQHSAVTQAFTWEPTAQPVADPEPLKPAMDKKKRHTAFKVSLIIMACVLATALLILVGALIYNLFDTYPDAQNKNVTVNVIISDKGPTNPGDGYASPELLEEVKNSIVVISAQTADASSLGSGFIISDNGYIVTNQHVIDGASEIWVDLYDGRSYQAKVVGASERDDIAVLKISASDLPPITLARSEDSYVGEVVYAIGCPDSYDFAWSVTMGIISHTSRNVKIYNDDGSLEKTMNLIQTDVSVNPGNSGGPIINTRGEVVGIVTLKITNTEGMGFAIPIDGALEIIDALITKGSADDIESSISAPRPMIGISCVGVSANKYYKKTSTGIEEVEKTYADHFPDTCFYAPVGGIYVMSIDERYNAVGVLEAGDIIVSLDGAAVYNNNQFSFYLNNYKPGDRIQLEVYRDGGYKTVKLTLAKEIKE